MYYYPKKEDFFTKIPNVQYTISIQAITLATYAAYAYATNSISRDDEFRVSSAEIRRYYEFFKTKGRVENFDPNVIMGSTTGSHPFIVSGKIDTSI